MNANTLKTPDLERFWPRACATCGVSKSAISAVATRRHWMRYADAAALLKDIRSSSRFSTLIDWGCGTGYGTAYLKAHDIADLTIGYDVSGPALSHARHEYPDVKFTESQPETRNALLCMVESIEHMPRAAASVIIAPALAVFLTTPFCATAANQRFSGAEELRSFMAQSGHRPVEERFWHDQKFTDAMIGVQYLALFAR